MKKLLALQAFLLISGLVFCQDKKEKGTKSAPVKVYNTKIISFESKEDFFKRLAAGRSNNLIDKKYYARNKYNKTT